VEGLAWHGRCVEDADEVLACEEEWGLALRKEVPVRIRRLLVLLAVAGVAAGPLTALAQERVADQASAVLDATDRRIEQGAASLSGAADSQARGELDAARAVQARARSAFGAARYALAFRLTLEAQRRANRAVALAGGLPDPDRVRTQLERSREMLDLASERIQGCGDARARAMLQVATEMEDRAESAERSGRNLGALQLSMAARERGQRALRLCRMAEDPPDATRRALRRTDQVLSRARDVLSSGAVGRPVPGQAPGSLTRAEGLQDEANRQLRAGRNQSALKLTLAARALAHRAVRIATRTR
jgi:hypothetical protein